MSRLLVICEGQTEETFVNEVLAPHLGHHGWQSVTAKLMGNARQKSRRGGIRGWPTVRREIDLHLRQDSGIHLTTLVDYYALPAEGDKAWPGRAEAARLPFAQKTTHIHQSIQSDLAQALSNGDAAAARVVPFVIMHEFETLCFADCALFAEAIGQPQLAPQLQAIRDQFNSPEEINDNPETAPSKRILGLHPSYQKEIEGNVGVIGISLSTIRSECALFGDWLAHLESIRSSNG